MLFSRQRSEQSYAIDGVMWISQPGSVKLLEDGVIIDPLMAPIKS
jgi:hypothetical protein